VRSSEVSPVNKNKSNDVSATAHELSELNITNMNDVTNAALVEEVKFEDIKVLNGQK